MKKARKTPKRKAAAKTKAKPKRSRATAAKATPKRAGTRSGAKSLRSQSRSRVARTIAQRDDALDELETKVRPGKVKLGSTRRLTPTKAGFRALKKELASVARAVSRKKRSPRAYTFQLSIRYRGADGRFKKLDNIDGSFPLKASINKRRRKKGESIEQAFERVSENKIKAAVFRAIDRAEGVATYTPTVERALASGDRERIGRAMRAFKKRRGVTFKVTVDRHVTAREGAQHDEARKRVSRGTRRRKRK